MKNYKYFYLTIFFLISAFMLGAQHTGSTISGYVYNPDHEPAMYSTVMLMDKDTVLVKGAFSQEDGSFVFDRIDPGEYYIQVRNVEFKTYLSDMISVRQNDQYIMDHIVLSPANIDLGEVVVTADKALVEIHSDKMVYNVSASVNASGSSGLELLGKASRGNGGHGQQHQPAGRTFDNQRFGFSLTWNFGNQQAKARQRNRSAIDDEMRRIAE